MKTEAVKTLYGGRVSALAAEVSALRKQQQEGFSNVTSQDVGWLKEKEEMQATIR